MPTVTIPLVGSINNRGTSSTKDQRFLACFFNVARNPVSGNATAYCVKRPGFGTVPLVAGDGTALFYSPSTGQIISCYGLTTTTVYLGTTPTNAGTISTNYVIRNIIETIISEVTYYVMPALQSNGLSELWYLASDAATVTAYTCDTNGTTTIADIKISGANSTAGMYVGQLVTGADIPAGTRIASINSGAFTAVLTAAATGTTNDMALTKTPIAKVLDADLPSDIIGPPVEKDGYVFVMTESGKIYNSDINTISSWTATNFISSDNTTDEGVGLMREGNNIVGVGNLNLEWFYNAGNAVGSPLSKLKKSFPVGGSGSGQGNISSNGPIACWASVNTMGASIWALIGGSPKRISTPFIDALVGASDSTSFVTSFMYKGSPCVAVNGFLYQSDLDTWIDMNMPSRAIILAGNGTQPILRAIEDLNTTGKIFSQQEGSDTWQDNSASYTMTIQTARINHGTDKRKFVKSVRLIADNQESGTATLEKSDDDYGTFTTLGTFDMTSMDKRINRCGSYKGGRSYRITHSANTAFRAEALEIEYEVGSS